MSDRYFAVSIDGDGQRWGVVVEDNGHGMDSAGVRHLFFNVGSDRCTRSKNNPDSLRFGRPVTGRFGSLKLAALA